MSSEDHIETAIGRFGRYQSWVLFLILARYSMEFQLLNVVFIIPGVEYTCLDDNASNSTNFCPCERPEYDKTTIVSSVTSEWNLICERGSLASLAQSMLQVGILFGSLIFGYVSDRYGRKIAMISAMFLLTIFVTISALVPEFWMFLVCRFLIGAGSGGCMLCAYVLVIELSGKSFKPYIICLNEVSFVTAYFFLPIIAYFVREWRYLQLASSVPWLTVIVYFWLIPESPRWLITVGKKKEAIEVLTYIAKKNNRNIDNIEEIVNKIELESMSDKQLGTYADLFKTPKIRFYTILTAIIWMFVSHTFFGINQYIGLLQGNVYLNVILSAVCLLPGPIIVLFTTLYLGRKVSAISYFIIAAVPLLIFIFIPNDLRSVALVFAIIGQIGAYTAFVQVYLFSSEIFPTVIRNSAMGFASVFARFGGFIAPFVVNIGVEWVSMLVFSGVAFGGAILCSFLPETRGTVLLNTIQQTEKQPTKKLQSL